MSAPKETLGGQVQVASWLADAYAGKLIYIHRSGWYHYDGTCWAPDEEGYAWRAVRDVMRKATAESPHDEFTGYVVHKCTSASGIKGVLKHARTMEPLRGTVHDLAVLRKAARS